MNYRHIYHAGNFCDIIKHLTLVSILKSLLKKEKPFTVLDCFAGIGIYDIASEEANKTNESETGIKKVIAELNVLNDPPLLLNDFLRIITAFSNTNLYPGSPLIIKNLLRSTDQLIACELHKDDYETLKKNISNGVHKLDAYQALKAFLPFKDKRGLIFLDPAFEVKNELEKLVNALRLIKQRAENICTLIWFPLKNQNQISEFYKNCKAVGFKEIIKIEFSLKKRIAARHVCDMNYNNDNCAIEKYYMNSCGLLIVNPPDIIAELRENISYLIKIIYKNEATGTVGFL